MNFFISDTHFGHANIIKYCNRPFVDAREMDKILIDNWNSTVSKKDTVYHLGDFSFKAPPSHFSKKLNGHKILIQGNHDRVSQCRGHFDEIHDRLKLNLLNRVDVLLSHYPYVDVLNNHDHKFKDRMLKFKGLPLLHNSRPMLNKDYKMINCSVEWHSYTPISEIKIIEYLDTF